MERRMPSILGLCLALVLVSVFAGSASAQVSCAGLPAFQSCTAYANGASVVFNNTKYTAIAPIPATRDCPPNSPYTPATDNWWVNNGACSGGATATATARPTATATTGTRATATATTRTRVTATATTRTRATATATTPRATATATTGTGSNNAYQAAYWTQGNDPCTNSGAPGSGEEWNPIGACSGQAAWNASTQYNGGAQVCRSCGGTNPTPTSPRATATATTGSTATATATNARPTPTPTTCGAGCGGGLPANVITGYWHNFNNGSTTMKLNAIPAKYNLIAVAFADAGAAEGSITFNLDPATGYTDVNEFKSHISSINASGRKVIISDGGETGRVSVGSSTAATNFANSLVSLMDTYGFAGVDIDLENGLNATFMGQALRNVKSRKPSMIFAMAPQTIDMQAGQVNGNGYFKLARDLSDMLTVCNMQYYNSGCMLGCDNNACYGSGNINFLTALACIQLQNGLRPDQVGIGVPASPSGAGSGYVSPSVVNNAMRCLESRTSCGTFVPPQAWPGIRGAMTWSINWDAVQGYSWVNAISVP
jgi:chitinase